MLVTVVKVVSEMDLQRSEEAVWALTRWGVARSLKPGTTRITCFCTKWKLHWYPGFNLSPWEMCFACGFGVYKFLFTAYIMIFYRMQQRLS